MELQITAIKDGIVIDHIPSDRTFKIFELLKLKDYQSVILIAENIKSSSLGKKGLIKIENKKLCKDELGEIALVAPTATINIIENYIVIEKLKLEIPDIINNLIVCNNPKCISNHEKINTRFHKLDIKNIGNNDVDNKSNYKFKCHYCEKTVYQDELILK